MARARALPPLPDPAELHAYARASTPRKGNVPPPAFVEARARVDALEAQLTAARGDVQELVRDAYAQGVAPSTLARWAGYTPRWIRVLVGAEEAS